MKKSSSDQRTSSIEESKETEPSVELSKQSDAGQGTANGNLESEKIEPSEETSKQTDSAPTSIEVSEETEPSEELLSKQPSSDQEIPIDNEKSEKTELSEDNLSQFISGQRTADEKSIEKVSNFLPSVKENLLIKL